jgi:hypothetical protein
MSETQEGSAEQNACERRAKRLVARAQHEHWGIPRDLRRPLIDRLGEIVRDPTTGPRDVISAARAILSASKINLDNISAAIKADQHTVLERRMTELEQSLEKRESPGSW